MRAIRVFACMSKNIKDPSLSTSQYEEIIGVGATSLNLFFNDGLLLTCEEHNASGKLSRDAFSRRYQEGYTQKCIMQLVYDTGKTRKVSCFISPQIYYNR